MAYTSRSVVLASGKMRLVMTTPPASANTSTDERSTKRCSASVSGLGVSGASCTAAKVGLNVVWPACARSTTSVDAVTS